MRCVFTVTVEVNRVQGKFASREEIETALKDEIESADPGSIDTDNDAEYEVTEWTVEAEVGK